MDKSYYIDRCHKSIDELANIISQKEAELEKATFNFTGAKIQGLEGYKLPNYSFSISDYPDQDQKKVDEIYENDKQVRERNKVVAESNKKIKDALITLMKNLGFSETTRQKKKNSRSRWGTQYESVQASWSEYLDFIPTDYWGGQIDRIYKELCERIDRKRKDKEAEQKKLEAERQAKEREREKLKLLVSIGLKYGKEFHCVDSAIDHILSQDKYLALAYYLEKNRGDWSDGCDYARTGLGYFKIETPTDHLIFKELTEICADFEDGRSFRDCEWNYSVLFGMANEDLLKDLRAVQEYESRW